MQDLFQTLNDVKTIVEQGNFIQKIFQDEEEPLLRKNIQN